MMNRKIYFYIYVLIAMVSIGCSRSDREKILTVSIEPQRYLLERIAGDRWTINTLLDKGADPESFNPSMSAITNAMKSRAYFKIGNMPFEDQVADRVAEGGDNVMIFDCSDGITMIEGTHCSHHHSHNPSDVHHHSDGADPHVWSSVRNAIIIAENMLKAMVQLDPENAETYRENHAKLKEELQLLDSDVSSMLNDRKGTSFLVWHPSLSYFARDYDLEQISLGAENKELSVAGFRDKIDQARAHNVGVFFIQPEYDMQRSQEVADQATARVVTVNLLGYDWPDEMKNVAKAIKDNN